MAEESEAPLSWMREQSGIRSDIYFHNRMLLARARSYGGLAAARCAGEGPLRRMEDAAPGLPMLDSVLYRLVLTAT